MSGKRLLSLQLIIVLSFLMLMKCWPSGTYLLRVLTSSPESARGAEKAEHDQTAHSPDKASFQKLREPSSWGGWNLSCLSWPTHALWFPGWSSWGDTEESLKSGSDPDSATYSPESPSNTSKTALPTLRSTCTSVSKIKAVWQKCRHQ